MGRGGRRIRPEIPERTCIVSGEKLPQPIMIRFVVSAEGAVVADVDGKLPGRGIWIKADRGAVEHACRRKLFSRAARRSTEVPDDLLRRTESSLVRRVSGLLSLARKSGRAVAGFEKVRDEMNRGRAALLLQAADGSPRQVGKLAGETCEVERVRCLTADELGMAFGRQNVIHAALKAGGICERVRMDARRLSGLRKN